MKTRWKILIVIILAALVSYLFGCEKHIQNTFHEKADYRPSVGRLVEFYRVSNEQYFMGGLPGSKTEIKFSDLSVLGDMATIDRYSNDTWLIRIDPAMHPTQKQAEMSLFHEMCHQEDKIAGADEGLDSHSNAFEVCMLSIAKQGGFKGLW